MGDLSANFSRREFECRCGCGFNTVDKELLDVLESLRRHFDKPIHITSGCRCVAHNLREGGAANSRHIIGQAADFKIQGIDPEIVADFLENRYPHTYGIGRYLNRTHLDVRATAARWVG